VSARARSSGWLASVIVLAVLWVVPFLGAFAFGSGLATVALVATTAWIAYASVRHGLPGALLGVGLALVYLANLNSEGPGTVCHLGQCRTESNPWLLGSAGFSLIAIGSVLLVRRYHQRH
jgi:hypothetical protein